MVTRKMATPGVIVTVVLGVQFLMVCATAAMANDDADYLWQKQMLFQPSDQQLQMEGRSQVFVYHGIKSTDIDLAMDTHYDRIENMMFVNTVWTNEKGEPLVDPYTGNPLVDNDC